VFKVVGEVWFHGEGFMRWNGRKVVFKGGNILVVCWCRDWNRGTWSGRLGEGRLGSSHRSVGVLGVESMWISTVESLERLVGAMERPVRKGGKRRQCAGSGEACPNDS
jgi:hypothetical protein